MFTSFHFKGTIPSCRDMLNSCASGVLICSTVSFSILDYIPSTPGDLFSFILLIWVATTSGVTTNCPNISPSGPLNFVSGTGNELVSSLVNTELKCKFNSSPIRNPCVIIFRPLSSSDPTLSQTFFLHTHSNSYCLILLEWTTKLDTSSRTLFVREGQCRDVYVTSNVELRNNVRLLLNVELRNYVISRQIVERRVTSDCYLNIVVSLDC